MTSEKTTPDRDIEEYQSILDKIDILSSKIFNTILPGKRERRKYYLAILYTPIIFAIYIYAGIRVGESQQVYDNFLLALTSVFAVSFLLIAENTVGDDIRNTVRDITRTFDIRESELKQDYLNLIFSRWRIVIGILTSLFFTTIGVLFVLNYPVGGHNSLIIKYSSIPLLSLLAFILGEAGSGAIFTLYKEFKLLDNLSERMQIMNKQHHKTLKDVASWSINIAGLLSIIASAIFIALITNPHINDIYLDLPGNFGELGNTDIRNIIFGFFGVILVLILVLFIVPITAIRSNIAESKQDELDLLSSSYNKYHEEIIINLANEVELPNLREKLDYVETIALMEDKVKKVSTMPYDIQSLRRIIEVVSVPVVTFLSRNMDILALLGIN